MQAITKLFEPDPNERFHGFEITGAGGKRTPMRIIPVKISGHPFDRVPSSGMTIAELSALPVVINNEEYDAPR